MKNTKARKEGIKKEKFYKFSISISFLIFITILYPGDGENLKKVYFRAGEIVPYDIISPFELKIPKEKEEIEREIEIVAKSIKPCIFKNPEFKENTGNIEIKNFILEKDKKIFMKKFNELYTTLVKKIIVEDKEILKKYGEKVILKEGENEKEVSLDEIMDIKDVEEIVKRKSEEFYSGKIKMQRIFYEIFLTSFKPNYKFDEDFTKRRIEEAKLSIVPYKYVILKGEKIIGAHERVTPQIEEKLSFLQKMLKQSGTRTFTNRLGIFFLFSLIFLIFYYITRFYFKKIYDDILNLTAHFINLIILILSSYILIKLNLDYYFVPFPFFVMISGIISSPLFGMFTNFLGSLYLSIYFGSSFQIFLFFIFIGTVGTLLIRFLKTRFYLYSNILVIFLTGFGITLFLSFVFGIKYEINKIFLGNLLSSVISISFLSVFLILYERVFGITTDFVLMELLNFYHPLLIELKNKAGGTFVHSEIVANLAESAAKALGANSLLARVGAYFHDIGKLLNPDYYAENQTEHNPHDKLSPKISALIVKNHVKYGVQLARKYHLPKEIINIIESHHGTTCMVPFYEKARISDPDIGEDEFRYQGPKPRTKEEAIIMLADTVEAAARSLEEVNPLKIREMVKEMIRRRFEDGQLDECDIKRKDLEKIEEVFIPILISQFHGRPEYKKF